jgi:hypothetical protein
MHLSQWRLFERHSSDLYQRGDFRVQTSSTVDRGIFSLNRIPPHVMFIRSINLHNFSEFPASKRLRSDYVFWKSLLVKTLPIV